MDSYYELLDNWENSTENFLLWVEIVSGINKVSKTYTDLKEEVTDVKEIEKWVYYFNGDLDSIEITTEKYMETKRSAA